jgi:hypothetical protein
MHFGQMHVGVEEFQDVFSQSQETILIGQMSVAVGNFGMN